MSDLLDLGDNMHASVAPANQHFDGHRLDKARFSKIVDGTMRWSNKQQPTPGALSYAYESLALPEFGVVGSGIGPSFFFRPLQGNMYQQNKSVPTTGYGGLISGTVYSQPLYDPDNNTWGGALIE